MIYKRFRGTDYRDALYKLKNSMGDDAIILDRRNIKEGGILGVFKKRYVEITAGIQEDKLKKKKEELLEVAKKHLQLEKTKKQDNSQKSGKDQAKMTTGQIEKIMKKLDMLEQQIGSMNQEKTEKEQPEILRVIKLLKQNEFSDDYINGVIGYLKKTLSLEKLKNWDNVEEKVYEYIRSTISIGCNIKIGEQKPLVYILVGPTGVGKTTTVAKLAATYGLCNSTDIKIKLVTIDMYRIGAEEQLRKYAEIMDFPFASASTNQDFKKIISLSNADLILVDTIGRNQKNNLHLAEMKEILEIKGYPVICQLAVSSSTKVSDLHDIIKRFNQFFFDGIIVTKTDETNSIGSILSVISKYNKTISYITDGQSVPDNIKLADKNIIMNYLHGFNKKFALAQYK